MALSDRSYDRLGQLLLELADELRPLVGQLLAAAALDAGMPDDRQLSAGDADPWLSPGEAAARVGVHRRTIYRALTAGTLEGGQLATGAGACRWRIRASEVDRWAGNRGERFTAPVPRPTTRPADAKRTTPPDSYRTRLKEPRQ